MNRQESKHREDDMEGKNRSGVSLLVLMAVLLVLGVLAIVVGVLGEKFLGWGKETEPSAKASGAAPAAASADAGVPGAVSSPVPVPAAPAPVPQDPRLAQAQRLLRTDAPGALKLCREIAAEGSEEPARQAGLDLMVEAARQVMDRLMQQRKFQECETLVKEINEQFPDSMAAKLLTQKWSAAIPEQCEAALQAGDMARTAELLQKLLADPALRNRGESLWWPYVKQVQEGWKPLAEAGKWSEADTLFGQALSITGSVNTAQIRDQFAEYRVVCYRSARTANQRDAARQNLLNAADTQGLAVMSLRGGNRMSSEYTRACREEWDSDGLLAEGDRFRRGNRSVAAMAFYSMAESAATYKVTYDARGVPHTTTTYDAASRERADRARQRLQECAMAAVRSMAAGIPRGATKEMARELARSVLFLDERRRKDGEDTDLLKRKCEAGRELLALEMGMARDLVRQGKTAEAEKRLEYVQKDAAVELWHSELQLTRVNPWPQVPKDLVDQINRERPGANDEQRLQALRNLAQTGRYEVPQARQISALLGQLKTLAVEK